MGEHLVSIPMSVKFLKQPSILGARVVEIPLKLRDAFRVRLRTRRLQFLRDTRVQLGTAAICGPTDPKNWTRTRQVFSKTQLPSSNRH